MAGLAKYRFRDEVRPLRPRSPRLADSPPAGRRRADCGQTSTEYLGLLLVVAAILAAIVASGVGGYLASSLKRAVCEVAQLEDCGSGEASPDRTPGSVADEQRIAALEDNAARRRDELGIETEDAAGSRYADLHQQIDDLIEQGRLDEAEQLDRELTQLVELARGDDWKGSERGFALVENLGVPDDVWQRQVEASTEYRTIPPGSNLRYFDVPAAPGQGLVALDFFIPTETSGLRPVKLEGDDRGFDPNGPLDQDLGLGESRVIMVLDRETGRGVIYQSPTCNVVYDQCREARPISLDMDERTQFVPELSDEASGPYIAPANRFEIDADGEGVRIRYDALNSLTWPGISVDGDFVLAPDADGRLTPPDGCLDDYPSIGIYQYQPGDELRVVDERPGEDVFEGAPGGC